VSRHVYQSSQGGKTTVPLEDRARVLGKATPRFNKMLSWKYAQLSGKRVQEDLSQNHGVKVSKKLIQGLMERLGSEMIDKELKWHYEIPPQETEVSSIGISRDGTTVPIKGEGYKEAMTGTISLYDRKGNRLHTIYTGCSPEHGRSSFESVFSMEIEGVQRKYPQAKYVGVADGEKGNWRFLSDYTHTQIIDFYHATTYLGEYAKVVYKDPAERKKWIEEKCSDLKNKAGGAIEILAEMKQNGSTHFSTDKLDPVNRAITYFGNHKDKMNYEQYQKENLPIGSGVVEAACKTLIKQRFGRSGSKWTRQTVDHILMARGLILTKDRWKQFWEKVDRYGF
jgi:hypothetical protein